MQRRIDVNHSNINMFYLWPRCLTSPLTLIPNCKVTSWNCLISSDPLKSKVIEMKSTSTLDNLEIWHSLCMTLSVTLTLNSQGHTLKGHMYFQKLLNMHIAPLIHVHCVLWKEIEYQIWSSQACKGFLLPLPCRSCYEWYHIVFLCWICIECMSSEPLWKMYLYGNKHFATWKQSKMFWMSFLYIALALN